MSSMPKLYSNPAESREVVYVASSTATWVPMLIVVGLRFLCRYKSRARFWIDDWCALAAFIIATVLYFLTLIIIREYTGHHIGDVDMSRIDIYGKANYFCGFGYGWILALVKLSFTAFYWRIFATAARWPMITIAVCTIVWVFTWSFLLLFQCKPMSAAWEPMAHEPNQKCLNMKSLWAFGPLPHVLIDIALLVLPMPYIFNLKLRIEQRLSLCSIFALGFFVTVVSIMRINFIYKIDISNIDFTWTFTETTIWSAVEINCAVICACLPCLKPLINLVKTGSFGTVSKLTSVEHNAPSTFGRTVDVSCNRRSNPMPAARWPGRTFSGGKEIDSASDTSSLRKKEDIPLEQIVVTTHWEVEHE